MATVYRVTADWTGFLGAPGYSRFNFDNLIDGNNLQASVDGVRAFFFAVALYLPSTCRIQVRQLVEHYDDQTGKLIGESSAATLPPVVAGSANSATAYGAGAGAVVLWKTATIFNGRRIQGRTFLVPMVNHTENNGTLSAAVITAMQTAADTLLNLPTANLVIWAKLMSGSEPPTQIGGRTGSVISAVIPDRNGILRSRRD